MSPPRRRPRRFDRNLIVIGAGSAGLVASLVAARLGARVTLIEAERMGGDCLNTGCVPSKALLHVARLAAAGREAAALGLLPPPGPPDSAAAFRHLRTAIAAVAPHDSEERFRGLGVDVRRGHARITSPWSVAIGGETLTTRGLVIAAGAAPVVPDLPGLDRTPFFTSETIWQLDRAPGRLLVLGGGPVGCELAQGFARLGSSVTLVQRGPHLLPREDEAVSDLVRARLEAEGVTVLTNHTAVAAGPGALRFADRTIPFDALLLALGRRARTAGYGLEETGVVLNADGTIRTDARLRSSVPSLYACGDVAGPYQFTHAAGFQGAYAALGALFGLPFLRPGRTPMPAVTYTDPEVARIGLTERAERAAGTRYELTECRLADLDRAIVENAREGVVRVLTAPGSDRILGAAIVAPRAGEMLGEFILAMTHGMGLKRLFGPIRPYPTWLEANREAASAWRTAHAPGWLPEALGRFLRWRLR
ncbi:MAG TPA: FAD-dependent oxidoreductase [Acetobacteraceae bacterium]|nr:FAD-dependent oxidoreductase [Acetobacteraceae bacterium]